MKCEIDLKNKKIKIDLDNPLDISMPLSNRKDNPSAWYLGTPIIEPVKGDGFIGSVAKGSSVNFRNISFNPHGHGTHTECVGHISEEVYSINKLLKTFHFTALVITITPDVIRINIGNLKIGDKIITLEQIKNAIGKNKPQAIIIRTLPNKNEKLTHQYSNTNPAYLAHEAAKFITDRGIDHLLIDLPSVDKENDNGELLAHKAFWQYPNNILFHKTITELIYVDDIIKDGEYILNLQFAPFENDASPSKPVLYKIEK
jgi:arylformamidase